jgi:hypothetical protein
MGCNLRYGFFVLASAAILTACSSGGALGDTDETDAHGAGDDSGKPTHPADSGIALTDDGGHSSSADGSLSPNQHDAGDSETDAVSSNDDGPSDTDMPDVDGFLPDGACSSTVQNTAPGAQENVFTTPAPTPTGGTIVGGTYYFTALNVYAPCVSPFSAEAGSLSATSIFTPLTDTSGIIDEASESSNGVPSSSCASYMINGTTITAQGDTDIGSFTATSSTIDLIATDQEIEGPDGGLCLGTIVEVLTKQ